MKFKFILNFIILSVSSSFIQCSDSDVEVDKQLKILKIESLKKETADYKASWKVMTCVGTVLGVASIFTSGKLMYNNCIESDYNEKMCDQSQHLLAQSICFLATFLSTAYITEPVVHE